MSLERLLHPKTIAVVGGGAWCEAVVKQCMKSGFAGKLLAVHPKRDTVGGIPSVPSIDALPWAPDAAFLGINRTATVDVLQELSARGGGGAVCFASGFSESDDRDGASLQQALAKAAGDMAVLGPNCYGFINNLDGAALWPDQHGLSRQTKGVAILTQSSNIAINLTMQKRGLPIAYMITTGNQALQDLASIAMALLDDTRITAIGLHIEGFKDVAQFEQLATKAQQRSVPIIALKVGVSAQAQLATQSHTASLAGSHAGANALLKRCGVCAVQSLPELLEALKLAHVFKRLPGGRLASLSCSGGEASLMADAVERHAQLSLPSLPKAASDTLINNLGPHVTKVNPLDYHTDIWRDKDAMIRVFSAMTGEPFDLTIVVLDFPRSDRCDIEDWIAAVEAINTVGQLPSARIAVLASFAENLPEEQSALFLENGVVPLMELDVALPAVASLANWQAPMTQPVWLPHQAHAEENLVLVDEALAKRELAKHGVRVPHQVVVHSADGALEAAKSFSQTMVLKGLGAAHKSEAGWVALNLNDAEQVYDAAISMTPAPAQWLLEDMVTDVIVELLLGVVHDPAHGYVLTIGAGGVLTELLSDSVSLLLPVTATDIEQALNSLIIAPQLNGYRSSAAVDMSAIIEQVLALQRFVEHHQHKLHEVEINPLLCSATSAIAADALLRILAETPV